MQVAKSCLIRKKRIAVNKMKQINNRVQAKIVFVLHTMKHTMKKKHQIVAKLYNTNFIDFFWFSHFLAILL